MKVAIFGAGTMGSGIAQVFAAKGHTALMYASSVASAQRHKDNLAKSLQKRVEKGKMTQEAVDALLANVLVEEKSAAADADLVIDVRFLPNPFYDPEMRTMTGLDQKVHDYVLYNSDTETFLKRWEALLDCVMPGYVAEGKQQLSIAVGCTGGQHRSVALAEVTGDYLRRSGYRVSVAHRDLGLAISPSTTKTTGA